MEISYVKRPPRKSLSTNLPANLSNQRIEFVVDFNFLTFCCETTVEHIVNGQGGFTWCKQDTDN